MSGPIDPETIYTKQTCIGKDSTCYLSPRRHCDMITDCAASKGGGSFGRVYKG